MKFTIVRSQNVPSPDPNRAGETDTLIVYQTLDDRTGYATVAGADPTDDDIVAAVTDAQSKHDGRVGRTLGG